MVQCNLCSKLILRWSYGVECKNRTFYICKECDEDVYHSGYRFPIDIAVVPIQDLSFRRLKNDGLFVAPSWYMKKNPKMLAFYRGIPIRAITHIARVADIRKKVPKNEVFPSENDKQSNWKKYQFFDFFKIADLCEIKHPILGISSSTIQNRIYVSFQAFLGARNIRDLFKRKRAEEIKRKNQ